MNTQKMINHLRKNYTKSEQAEKLAELCGSLDKDQTNQLLKLIFEGMKTDEIGEALEDHFRTFPKPNRWADPVADFYFDQLRERETPAEIFTRAADSINQRNKDEQKAFNETAREFLNIGGQDMILRVPEVFNREKIADFVCREIYPYYNEQQAFLFAV